MHDALELLCITRESLSTNENSEIIHKLKEQNQELLDHILYNENEENLSSAELLKRFYEDVQLTSARIDARIRAVETSQLVDLDEKYGIMYCLTPHLSIAH